MRIRSIIAGYLICCSTISSAQLAGEFYLEKATYALGEPVFVYFRVRNDGAKPDTFYSNDPHSGCSGYKFSVSNDPPSTSCLGWGISCGVFRHTLQPGQSFVERALLNLEHRIDTPGKYTVHAERRPFPHPSLNDSFEVHSTLYFDVGQDIASASTFQLWVEQFRSADLAKRVEAARVLASIAPRSLEVMLLAFADDAPYIRQFAPMAFHRLNTPRSVAALAKMLAKTEPGTSEHQKVADYLANRRCWDDP